MVASATDVFVGGNFTDAAGIAAADYVARWSSGSWSCNGQREHPFSGGALPNGSGIWALAYKATASGYYLYIGGFFTNAAGIAAADYVVRWDGTNYAALGASGSGNGALNQIVLTLAVSGNDVYAGGAFTDAGSGAGDYVARFDGATWNPLGSNGAGNGALTSNVHALAVSGSKVYVGGDFQNAAGNTTADYIAMWNGTSWSALGSSADGLNGALNQKVNALLLGSNSLYAGGSFFNIDPHNLADYVAAWAPLTSVNYKPDGRIKKGSTGTLVGNDIYNLDGTNQSRSASKALGTPVSFYAVDPERRQRRRQLQGGRRRLDHDVQRPLLQRRDRDHQRRRRRHLPDDVARAGAAVQIKAVVKVKSTATVGSSVSRLVTITSVADGAKQDAVKFTVKRS